MICAEGLCSAGKLFLRCLEDEFYSSFYQLRMLR